jgi:hypothetical protein
MFVLISLVFVLFVVYFLAAFVSYGINRVRSYHNTYALGKLLKDFNDDFLDECLEMSLKPRSVGCAAIDYNLMNCDQLRSLCTERGIKWRNVHGKNKHLKKAEMVSALS